MDDVQHCWECGIELEEYEDCLCDECQRAEDECEDEDED